MNFPAVTISAAYSSNANRLFEGVLNRLEFDCYKKDEACLNRTQKARKHFDLYIKRALEWSYTQTQKALEADVRNWKDISDKHHYLVNYLCDHGKFVLHDDVGNLSLHPLHLAEAFNQSVDKEKLQRDFKNEITRSFRLPRKSYLQSLRHLLNGPYNEPMVDCAAKIMERKYSDQSLVFAATVAKLSGNLSPEILLSQLVSLLGSNRVLQLLPPKSNNGTKFLLNIIRTLEDGRGFTMDALFAYLTQTYSHTMQMEELDNDKISCCQNINSCVGDKSQPCLVDATSKCCQLEQEISNNVETVMRLAKYVLGPPTQLMSKSEVKDINELTSNLQYSLRDGNANNVHSQSAIIACKFGNGPLTNDCDLFDKMFTTAGIGYTFNSQSFWKMYQKTTGTNAFYKQMFERTLSNDEEASPRKVITNGPEFSLEFYVRHDLYIEGAGSNTGEYKEPNKCLLKLHDPLLVPDMRNSDVELIPGVFYDISVIPSTIETDKKGLNLSPNTRDCLSPSDGRKMDVFQEYSQAGCLFECRLRKAVKECNCSSWDYPLPEGASLCHHRVRRECFNREMAEYVDVEECDCPNDCRLTQYIITPQAIPLTKKEACMNSLVNWYR